jgi:hypothetical protein
MVESKFEVGFKKQHAFSGSKLLADSKNVHVLNVSVMIFIFIKIILMLYYFVTNGTSPKLDIYTIKLIFNRVSQNKACVMFLK